MMASAFLLTTLMTSYPDSHFPDYVSPLLEDRATDERFSKVAAGPWTKLKRKLKALVATENEVDALRSEYIDLFDRGQAANPLHETEYGRARALGKGNELSDIAGFYRAFGFELGAEEGVREMLDHIAVELEFYALLLLKQAMLEAHEDKEGIAIVLDARKKFLRDHLGRFSDAILTRPGVQGSAFYSLAFECCHALIQDECARLDVAIVPVRWIDSEADAGAMACGSSGCMR